MKQKKQSKEQLIQANHKKWQPVWIAMFVLMALFCVYCIICPFFGVTKMFGSTVLNYPNPYYATYVVGILLLFCTVFYTNHARKVDKKNRHFAVPNRLIVIFAAFAAPLIILAIIALGKFEQWQGFYTSIATGAGRMFSLYGALLLTPLIACVIFFLPMFRNYAAIYYKLDNDLIVMAIFSVMGMVKLGCHAAGCCYGIHIDHILFGRGLFPVQLLEALSIFVTLGFLIWYQLKAKFYIPGTAYPLGLLLYCPVRFVWEYFRYHEGFVRIYVFNGLMTFWQFLSVIGFVMGAVWLGILLWQRRASEPAVPQQQEA